MNTSGTYSLSRAMNEEVQFSMAIGHWVTHSLVQIPCSCECEQQDRKKTR